VVVGEAYGLVMTPLFTVELATNSYVFALGESLPLHRSIPKAQRYAVHRNGEHYANMLIARGDDGKAKLCYPIEFEGLLAAKDHAATAIHREVLKLVFDRAIKAGHLARPS
jgi:hypothetical protein